jgi:hypothetical protein
VAATKSVQKHDRRAAAPVLDAEKFRQPALPPP